MEEKKIIKKRRSRAGMYTLLGLVFFVTLGLFAFSVFTYSEINSQFNRLEERFVQNTDALEDLNVKINEMTKEEPTADVEESEVSSQANSEIVDVVTLSDDSTVFNEAGFPFSFEYDTDWSISTPRNELKLAGQSFLDLNQNEIALFSKEDVDAIEDALQIEDADFGPPTVKVTYLKGEDLNSAPETFYESDDDGYERVEVMTIGAYQTEVFQETSGITATEDSFIEFGNDVLVVSTLSSKYAKSIISSIK